MKTVRPISILSMLIILQAPLLAQNYFGMAGGANFSKIHMPDEGWLFSENRRIGQSYRGFFEFSLNNRIALQPEINFIQKGIRRHNPGGTINDPFFGFDKYYRYDYLNVNFLGKLYLIENTLRSTRENRDKFNLNGYLIGGFYGGGSNWTSTIDLSDDPEETLPFHTGAIGRLVQGDFGGIVGLGTLLNKNRFSLFVEARYGHDLMRLNESSFIDGKIKHSTLIIELGGQLRISRKK